MGIDSRSSGGVVHFVEQATYLPRAAFDKRCWNGPSAALSAAPGRGGEGGGGGVGRGADERAEGEPRAEQRRPKPANRATTSTLHVPSDVRLVVAISRAISNSIK